MTGAQLYPGLAPGSEPFWPNRDPANPFPIPIAHYKWLVFADPNWDWRTFDFADPAGYQAFLQGRIEVRSDSQRHQSRSSRVPAARWQAAAVPRLERPADRRAEQHRLLRERHFVFRRRPAGSNRGAERRAELLPAVHGSGHGALWRRTRSELIRHADCARTVGGTRHRAGSSRRHASRPTAWSIARVPSVRTRKSRSTREGRHERRREFFLPRSEVTELADTFVIKARKPLA